MSRLEKIFLILTCVGAFSTAIVTALDKWRLIPAKTVTVEVEKRVEVTLNPNERMYCESKYCVYASPDGLRVINYSSKNLTCEPVPFNKELAGAGPALNEYGGEWWAIGRPGAFIHCHN